MITDGGSVRLRIEKAFIFTQGQSVAITGPSGAGKSTFLEALVGLNVSARNSLSLDGTCVSRLNAQAHLQLLRYCPQSPQFLEGSFDRSVLFGIAPLQR